jgi:hypothetical protein
MEPTFEPNATVPVLPRASQAVDTATLEPIRIATDVIELVGSVAPTGQRVTDMLLRGQDVAFLPRGAEPVPEAWIAVAAADIMWVVPPPLPPRRGAPSTPGQARLHVRIGPYRLIGSAHLAPNAPIDRGLVAAHPFLPLTGATVGHDGLARVEDIDVVIVNLARASEIRPLD